MDLYNAIHSQKLPHGSPQWVTRELLDKTRNTWQPYYTNSLTDSDLLEIVLNVSRLITALESHIQTEANT